MVLYAVIMLMFAMLSLVKQNKINKMIILIVCTILLTLLMALKSINVGKDTINYVYFFNQLASISGWIETNLRFEIGYQIFSKFISLFFSDYQYLFIVSAIICMLFVAKYIYKYSVNVAYSFFLLVGLRFFYFFLSGLRQSIAVSIILISYTFLKEKRYLFYIFFVLLASTFHLSAIVFLLALPVSKIRLNSVGIVKIIMMFITVYIMFDPILSVVLKYLPTYYSHYVQTEGFDAGNLANYIDFIIKISFIILAYISNYGDIKNCITQKNSIKKDVVINNQHTNIYFMIIASGLSLIATKASMLDRLQMYYWIFAITIIPDILRNFKRKYNKKIFFFIITILIFAYNLLILWLRPEWNKVVPYEFFWK